MYTLDQIIVFSQHELATKQIGAAAAIEVDLGCTGDDFVELLEKYARVFNVDMEEYC
jgi:hypothetical protein